MSLNLKNLNIQVQSIPSFSQDWKLISIGWEHSSSEFLKKSIELEVRENERGEEESTVKVTETRGEEMVVTKQTGDIVQLFLQKLEAFAKLIKSVNSLKLTNEIFGACDCPSKVSKLQDYRKRVVDLLKTSESVSNLHFQELSVKIYATSNELVVFEWPSLQLKTISLYDHLDQKRVQIHVADLDPNDVLLIVEIYMTKLVSRNTEFFIYYLYSKPDTEMILEYLNVPPNNQPFRKDKKNSKLEHTQRIPLDNHHYFILMISENAISGTVVPVDRMKRESNRLIRRHSWRRKPSAIWPFFAAETVYDLD